MICREKVVGAVMQILRRSLFLVHILGFFSWQVRWVSSSFGSVRHVFFMVRQVGLVKVRYGTFCFGRRGGRVLFG